MKHSNRLQIHQFNYSSPTVKAAGSGSGGSGLQWKHSRSLDVALTPSTRLISYLSNKQEMVKYATGSLEMISV